MQYTLTIDAPTGLLVTPASKCTSFFPYRLQCRNHEAGNEAHATPSLPHVFEQSSIADPSTDR
ncbi:hypothetical protein GQ56_0105200 [Burkholderia paludis]|nr:hypothetical protein GQ56_0105200 [Burkholderia paludis]